MQIDLYSEQKASFIVLCDNIVKGTSAMFHEKKNP